MSNSALPTLTNTIERGFVRASALMVIIMSVCVVTTHIVVGSLLAPHESATNRMKLAAQQAINAQEMVRLTSRLSTEKNPGSLYKMRADLTNVLERFSDTHRRITNGDAASDIRKRMSQSARMLIFDTTNGLDRWTRDIESAVSRDFLGNALGGSVEDAVALEEQVRLAYSTRLAQLIDQFANDSWISLRLIGLVRVGFVALFYISLAVVATMVLLPFSRRVVIMVRNQWLSDRADHADFDPITGFPNNDALCQFIKSHCDLNWTHNLRQAVLRIRVTEASQDIDGIDKALPKNLARAVAGRIKSVCRQGDFIARVSDNEFAISAIGLDNRTNVEALAERLIVRLNQGFSNGEIEVHVRVRIGVSFLDKSNRQVEEVLRQTERVLSAGDNKNSETIRFFEKSAARLKGSLSVSDVRTALEANEIEPHFQPFITMDEGHLAGIEVLPGWYDTERGAIGSGEFMSIADEGDFGTDIIANIVQVSLGFLQEWDAEGIDVPVLSFQMRRRDVVGEGFVEGMKWFADSFSVSPKSLGLTLSESEVYDDADGTLAAALKELGDHGFRISVNAFGGRKHSRHDLNQRRIKTLRISRAFVTNVASDAGQQSIVAENIAFGKEVGLAVVADGVETQAEQAMLDRLGCPTLAGPLFADPMPGHQMTEWLSGRAQIAAI